MSARFSKWALPLLVFAGVAAYFVIGVRAAVNPNDMDARKNQEQRLVEDRCEGAEAIDRSLLQQTWFYSAEAEEVAMVFGETGLTHYRKGAAGQDAAEGAYCIEGARLEVQYYVESYIPIGFEFESSSLRISYGRRISPKASETLYVKEITEEFMTLLIAGSGQAATYFRVN